jgi:hypothetical protein
MKLTSFTDYSLRVLMFLATNPERRATVAEVSAAFDIKENHLTKVVHFLGKQGWVTTLRGKGGGLLLARPANEIRVGRVCAIPKARRCPPMLLRGRGQSLPDLTLLPPERRAGRSRRRLLRRARRVHARRHRAQPERAGRRSSLPPFSVWYTCDVAHLQGTTVTADPHTAPYPYSGPPAMRKAHRGTPCTGSSTRKSP